VRVCPNCNLLEHEPVQFVSRAQECGYVA